MQIVKDNLPYVLAGEIESTELLIDSLLDKGKIQTKSTVVVRDSIYPISNTKYIKTVGPITSTKWGKGLLIIIRCLMIVMKLNLPLNLPQDV